MKLLLATAALATGACDRSEKETATSESRWDRASQRLEAAPAEAVNASERQTFGATLEELDEKDAAPAPAANDLGAVSRSWFVGRWTDTGECADAGEFVANGTYRLANGTRGMWNVAGGRLVIQHAEGRSAVRVRRVDDATIEVANEDGSTGRSTRC